MATIINVGQNFRIVGGSDRYLCSLSELLTQHKHDVIPFATQHEDNLDSPWNSYFPDSIDFRRPGPSDVIQFVYSPKAKKAMERIIGARRPDIAHLHIYYGQLTASILAPLRAAGIPIVQTLHEYKIVCPTYGLFAHDQICEDCNGRDYWHAAIRRCNKGSLPRSILSAVESYVSKWCGSLDLDHFIAVSGFLKDKVISLGIPSDKVTTVHNFMDVTGIAPNTAPGEYILYFGRLERTKGIYTLLDAMERLAHVPLLIVGTGSESASIMAEVESRGLEHVKMMGFKSGEELQALIRGSICTVAPSVSYETFGLTLIESFAHGRPVVASRIGGMTEVVTDGVDGWLVEPGDAMDLRSRIEWMAANRDKAVEMGQQGRKKVETKFDPESHYEKIMAVYRKVGVS